MKFAVVALFITFYAAFGVKSVEERSEKPKG